ncbi:MAG: sigma-70 family RNA polymerase sigma factor, partial [Gemmataceae bacterium]
MSSRNATSLVKQLRSLLGPKQIHDDDLLDRFASRREESAFAGLVERHGPLVWAACRRVLADVHDCEDAFQTTFLILVRKADSLERGRPLGNWLYTVAVNTALKVRGVSQRARLRPLENEPAGPETMLPGSDDLDLELSKLPERYRLPLVLCYLEGKTHEQAAAELRWPVGSVKGRLARGREVLREKLVRRGYLLSLAALTICLEQSSGAMPPAPLVEATRGLPAAASPRISTLADGIIKSMVLGNIKKICAVMMAVLALVAAASAALGWRSSENSGDNLAVPDLTTLAVIVPEPGPEPEDARKVDRPAIKAAWSVSLLPTKERPDDERFHYVQNVLSRAKMDQAIPPYFLPRTTAGLVVFRNHEGVVACETDRGELFWESYTDAGRCWSINPGTYLELKNWLDAHAQAKTLDPFRQNTQYGALSVDKRFAYLLNELPVYPPANRIAAVNKRFKDMVTSNSLSAIDLSTGKLDWILGGNMIDKNSQVAGHFFLGSPLPGEDGLLFVLSEKKQALFLSCLDRPGNNEFVPLVLWTEQIAATRVGLEHDPIRHTRAVFLARGDGIVVCPTHLGLLVAVAEKTHEVLWTFRYRQADVGQQTMSLTPPLVHDGKVYFMPPDGTSVYCLDLRTGQQRWEAPRHDGLYLVGLPGSKVVVIGTEGCRALQRTDGTLAWHAKAGVTSGVGVAAGERYYLPLRAGVRSGKPEICVLDLARGSILARFPMDGNDVPGNLALGANLLFTQSATQLAAYPL